MDLPLFDKGRPRKGKAMANRSMPLVLAGLTGVCMLVGAGAAQAAPPRCENITVDDLRQACIERVARCEPLKSAAERDECYRGRTPKTADGAAAGPIKLTPNAAPVPTAPKAASPAPSAAQVPAASPAPVPTPPPPAPPPPASTAVVVRPGQPPIMATPAPIPQPAPKVDPAQVSPPLPTTAAPAPLPKVVRPAPVPVAPAAVPATVVPPPRPTPGDGLDAVRGFYEALAQADGARANEFLVPEKRNSGAYEIGAMSRYYGNMREPVRLIAAEPMGNDGARVRYHYVYVNGRTCDGAAEVFLSRRDGRPLIERIRALNGC